MAWPGLCAVVMVVVLLLLLPPLQRALPVNISTICSDSCPDPAPNPAPEDSTVKNIEKVCGSDLETYDSQCLLECAATLSSQYNQHVRYSRIIQRSGKFCPGIHCERLLVRLYRGPCVLSARLPGMLLDVTSRRALAACTCPPAADEDAAVCGSDMQTYETKCHLDCVARRRMPPALPLEALRSGPCYQEPVYVRTAPSSRRGKAALYGVSAVLSFFFTLCVRRLILAGVAAGCRALCTACKEPDHEPVPDTEA